MKKKLLLTFSALSFAIGNAGAQAPFATMDSVDINQINASVLVHGDMWWSTANGSSHCIYPRGTQKNIGSAGALWMSAYDHDNNLHVAAQTYRQDGNDYWPGPIDTGAVSYATSHDWAKIWKVNRSDVNAFLANTTHDATNTPPAIWTWPASGNPHAAGNGGAPLSITENMAPFVDLNNDGIYTPERGEYPRFNGDQALWWVYNDNGPTHNETGGRPLGVQIEAMAYAYNRPTGIGRAIFYQYTIKNKSANNYHNFRIGQFADMDLGGPLDDFIGCDSTHSLAIVYNGATSDAVYGSNIPMCGLMMLDLVTSMTATAANSFIYYNNSAAVDGNPAGDVEYDNYLRAKFRTGIPLTNDFAGPGIATTGHGAGPQTNFVFNGDPAISTQWSECSSGNTPGDRRFIISSGDVPFDLGETAQLNMVLLTTTPGPANACGNGVDFTGIERLADTLRNVFDSHGAITGMQDMPQKIHLSISPNPAGGKITVEPCWTLTGEETIGFCTMLGEKVKVPVTRSANNYEADISSLSPGIYSIHIQNGVSQATATFVKN